MQGNINGFSISALMQELMTCAGHLDCYIQSNEILERFLFVPVSPSQVYRVTDYVASVLKSEEVYPERILPPVAKDEVLYVEIDGSMLCTRESEPWKEVKLGRLFKDSDCLNPNTTSSYLCKSKYVAHLEKSHDFGKRLQSAIDGYGELNPRLVFLSDGAAWIREWIADHYPLSITILDFYHAMEHLYQFKEQAFTGSSPAKQAWCDRQKALLLESDVEAVLQNIAATNAKEVDKKKLLTYYQNNKKRMRYKQYQRIGCGIIGSGAIESAHRTVIQKRMKLSEQRWSYKGAEKMLQLRVTAMNGLWHKVIDVCKKTKRAVAA